MSKSNTDVAQCLESDVLTSRQLQAATGLSQPAVSRQIGILGDRVVTLPNGKTPKYALTRNAFGSSNKIPLFFVDAHGKNTVVAYLRPLKIRGYFVELCPGASPLLLGVNGSGLFDDLPYYLQELRPQGFVGRQIARELNKRSGEFPADPGRWHASHIGRFLLSNGDDLPGNLQLGDAGLLRMQRTPTAHSRQDYVKIAENVLAGELTGSSAGGEQPKFTLYSAERSTHVIVKFSPPGDDAIARRWRDILITEYHATKALRTESVPAADVELIEQGDRLFLESARFDRTGQFGRSSMISMQMVDAEFVGNGADWPVVMEALKENELVSPEHYFDACVLWEFGFLIHNTDMHLGNMSLAITDGVFSMLPAYDMCSMGFAPIGGEVKPYSFAPQTISSQLDCLKWSASGQITVRAMAIDFWERVANDSRISDEFRNFLALGNPVAGLPV